MRSWRCCSQALCCAAALLLLSEQASCARERPEDPWLVAPRTQQRWAPVHVALAEEAEAFSAAVTLHAPAAPPIVLLGDSIVEILGGKGMGEVLRFREGLTPPQALAEIEALAPKLALGISGDRSGTVRWRLSDGELPAALMGGIGTGGVRVIVHVGTNDIALAAHLSRRRTGALPQNATELGARVGLSVAALATDVVDASKAAGGKARVLLTALLPRRDMAHRKWPDGVSEALCAANDAMAAYASSTRGIDFADCGGELFTDRTFYCLLGCCI